MAQEFSISPRFIGNVRRRDFRFLPFHQPFTRENNKKNNVDIAVLMILSEEVPLNIEEIQEILFNEFPNMISDMSIAPNDLRSSIRRLFEARFLEAQEA